MAIEQFMLNSFKWFFGSNRAEAQRVLGQFQAAFKHADARVLEEAAENPELTGMGTTVTMAFQLGAQLCLLHAGDSRAYLYRDQELQQLTQDHTVTAEMVRSGAITPGEADGHRLRHVITNVIGGNELGVYVEGLAVELRDGDRLLLCSDGLTEMVKHEAIVATLAAEPEPEAAARKLLAQANEQGGVDNTTVVIASFHHATATPTSSA
jgi:PPM family protein phosphatase